MSGTVNAEPRHHWYRDKKNWALLAVAVGSSLFATREISACRNRNDLIHCPDGGYGPYNGREYGARLGTSIFMAGLSIYGREHWRGAALNDAPVGLFSTWNIIVGVQNHRVPNYPREDASRFKVSK
jgi:hypothetical protein